MPRKKKNPVADLRKPNPRLNPDGSEILDPTPIAIPFGFEQPESLEQKMQRMIRHTVSQAAAEQGFETFEESNDFDVDDDSGDFVSVFEEEFDPVLGRGLTPDEFTRDRAHYEKMYDAAAEPVKKADLGALSNGPQEGDLAPEGMQETPSKGEGPVNEAGAGAASSEPRAS